MPRDLGLKARLEKAGLTVIEVAGWQTRGSETYDRHGHVNHHTAGPRSGLAPSLGICINGRSDLPGPLCNTYGDRSPTLNVYLVAAGRANHAGRGGWQGLSGNSSVSGHEEEHSGTAAEPLHPTRLDRMVRIAAAQAYGRFTPDEVCQHWEWTTRKIDFVRAHVDPTNFRLLVARRLYDMTHPMPPPLPQPPVTQEREVFFAKQGKGGDGKVFLFEETRMTHIKSRADLNALAASLGISNKEAVLSAETFQVLREGRTVYA